MKTKLIIIGAGGFGKEAAWTVSRLNAAGADIEIIGFCDDAPDKAAGRFAGLPLLGPLDGRFAESSFFCAIGNNRARKAATSRAESLGLTPFTLVDPAAAVAPDAVIGPGCFVGIGSIVSCSSKLGEGVIVNSASTIGHDVTAGAFAQLCPGARISGGCTLGEGAFIGTNASAVPLRRIGAWATLGIGMAALRDVPDGQTYFRP